MGRTTEEPIPVEETYRALLREAVKAAGGQDAVATAADINQGTVSRTISAGPKGERATYTTLKKLSAVLPTVPPPIVAVRDAEHERWCTLGAQLQQRKPEQFRSLLLIVEDSIGAVRPSEAKIAALKAIVSDPMPRTKKPKR